ncbi:hypothetical protein [Acetobacter pomorum]|nr:hypothetical protein [Acetobacter pomorum]
MIIQTGVRLQKNDLKSHILENQNVAYTLPKIIIRHKRKPQDIRESIIMKKKIDTNNAPITYPSIFVDAKERSQMDFDRAYNSPKRKKFESALFDIIILGGGMVHELGHYLTAKFFTSIDPVQIIMLSAFSAHNFPGCAKSSKQQSKKTWLSLRKVIAIFLSLRGTTWYAGSVRDDGYVLPNPTNAHIFSSTNPGRQELICSLGGPILQLIYGMILLYAFFITITTNSILLNKINLTSTSIPNFCYIITCFSFCVLLFSSSLSNIVLPLCNLYPYQDKKGLKSDGFIIKMAFKNIRKLR